jgi:hypothetical protein
MIKTTIGQLGLTIPIQSQSSTHSTIRLTPKDIERWRNDLPLADTGISSKKLYNLLLEINQTAIPPKERFTMLELLRIPTKFICQNLKKHYLFQITALSPQKIAIARLGETLQMHITYGYKTIIEELNAHKDNEDNRHILATCIERTLSAFNHILLRSYQLYSTPTAGTWSEIYHLYLYAAQEGFLKDPILKKIFEHIILLAATDPYKWRQSDQENLNNILDTWLPLTELSKASHFKLAAVPHNATPNLILIDPNTDQPPALLARKDLDSIPPQSLILDLHKLVNHLEELLMGMEAREASGRVIVNTANAETDASLPLNIIKGLFRDWSIPNVRIKPRTSKNEEVRVCLGLSATHYYVSNGRPFSTGLSESGPSTGTEPALPSSGTTGIQELRTTDEESIDLSMIPLPDEKRFVKLNDFKTTTCTIIDDAEGGRCILWEDDAYPPVQAGDVLGVQSTQSTSAPWQVGVVRWLRHTQNDKLKLGVQLLTDPVIAAGIQAVKDGQPSGQYLRCLIVKNLVITAPIPFRSGMRVMIRRVDQESITTFEADLVKLLESTGSHKKFQFQDKEARIKTITTPTVAPTGGSTPEPTHEEETKIDSKNSDDPFDSLWNQL